MKQSLFLSAATFTLQLGTPQALVGGRGNNVALSRAVRLAGEGEGPFSFQSPYNINNKRICTGYWRVGCTHDVQRAKRVWYHESIPKEDREPVSVEMCWNFCKNVSGAQYFGLENGDRCYCTPFFDDDHAYNDDMCDMPCVGNPGEMCGNQRLQSMWQMHDCNNLPPVPCGTPPGPVLHAKLFNSSYYGTQTPCSNTQGRLPLDATTNLLCSVECLPGYTLKSNDLKCRERGNRLTYSWSQVVGNAVCKPMHCGTLGNIQHAQYATRVFQFGETTQVTCDAGFEPSTCVGQPGCGNVATVYCGATTEYESTDALGNSIAGSPSCARKPCGECGQPNHTALTNAAPAVKVYQDTCKYSCDEGYTLTAAYPAPAMYSVECQDSGFEVPTQTCLPVSCDEALHRDHAVTSFASLNAQIDVQKVTFDQTVHYECDEGYSITGKYGGARQFNSTCLFNGQFSVTPTCKPNQAERPPHVRNADYGQAAYSALSSGSRSPVAATLDAGLYYYGDDVTYTCHNGYVLSSPAASTLVAGPDANWIGTVPSCDPVDCGAIPVFNHSTAVGGSATMNYESPALTYKCAPGYSTLVMDDLWNPTEAHFTVSCQANGNFTEPPKTCLNMDDCQLHTCGAYGTCDDLPTPTGNPVDDYTCNCNSGYEITLHPSRHYNGTEMKVCTNINDCPVNNACGGNNSHGNLRGICHDGVNNYTCAPSPGYEVTPLSSLPANETCTPVVCGPIENVGNATLAPAGSNGNIANYDTPKWTITCNQGYSVTGHPSAAAATDVWCLATGELTPLPTCKPISCGVPVVGSNADMQPQLAEVFFPTKITYTCDVGHAVEGNATGDRSFTADCLASGIPDYIPPPVQVGNETAEIPSCKPVKCEKAPNKANATWNQDKNFTYPDSARYTCDEGWSTNGTAGFDTFKLHCLPSGQFSDNFTCERVECTEPPTIGRTTRTPSGSGPFVYEDKVNYTVEPGYEIEVTVNGITSMTRDPFSCECGSGGKWSGACGNNLSSQAIDCGTPAPITNATITGDTKFASGGMTATCDHGYTTTGQADGQQTFNFRCKANGLFSAREECIQISCGFSKAVQHGTGSMSVFSPPGKKSSIQGGSFDGLFKDTVTYSCAEGYRAATVTPQTPIQQVLSTAPAGFQAECSGTTGDFNVLPSGVDSAGAPANANLNNDTDCYPVTCEAMVGDAAAIASANFWSISNIARMEFDSRHPYACKPGNSLNGTPWGALQFHENCTKTGDMTSTHTCSDIDWCLDGKCGANGQCADGSNTYTCTCDAGYEVYNIDAAHESCRQILECDTQGGHSRCSPGGGSCVDDLLKYTCNCTTGYENVVDTLPNNATRDSCSPVVCPVLPVVTNGNSQDQGSKLVYPMSAAYQCNAGYNIDGKAGSPSMWVTQCQATATLSGIVLENGAVKLGVLPLPQCHPISCGEAPKLPVMSIVGNATVVNGQQVTWQCDVGHTLNGVAGTASSKSIPCQGVPWSAATPLDAAGFAPAPYPKCQKIQCPNVHVTHAEIQIAPPTQAVQKCENVPNGNSYCSFWCNNPGYWGCGVATVGSHTCDCSGCNGCADAPPAVVYFNDTLEYTCAPGYVTPGGNKTFKAVCGAGGTYTGMNSCQKISCGAFPEVEQATYSAGAYVYEDEIMVSCSVGHHVNGQDTFKVTCGADGNYSNLPKPSKCVKRSCGVPKPCPFGVACHAAPTETSEMFYEDSAKWECNAGYTTDGAPIRGGGGVPQEYFTLECGANGNFTQAVPSTCKDIDFCSVGQPCGAVGVCADSGPGVLNPGYGCTCPDKYEVKLSTEGLPSCHMDDCQGQTHCFPGPDGQGGTCQDLSKTGGAQDQYACTCMLGYDMESSPERCVRKSCGTFPQISNTELFGSAGRWYNVTTWKGESVKLDTFVGQPLVNAYDTVTYTCAAGFSTDGSRNSAAKSFAVQCDAATGDSSRPLNPAGECKPMTCPEADLPVVANAVVTTSAPYWNNHSATWKCASGYKTDKADYWLSAGGVASCSVSSKIASASQCEQAAIDLGLVYKDNGGNSATFPLGCFQHPDQNFYFNLAATGSGHASCKVVCLRPPDQEADTFNVSCSSGSFGTPSKSCQKISCAMPESIARAAGVDSVDTSALYQGVANVKCLPNYGINGEAAKDHVTAVCKADGSFGSFSPGGVLDSTLTDWPACEPVSCGAVPGQVAAKEQTSQTGFVKDKTVGSIPVFGSLTAGQSLSFTCSENYTLNGVLGAPDFYNVTCDGSTGDLSGQTIAPDSALRPGVSLSGGPQGPGCKLITVPVSGVVTDAENGAVHIAGAMLEFWQNGVKVGSAVSDSNGEYSVDLPLGDTIIKSSASSQDYINREKGPISITGPIAPGQGADVAMSKVLADDQWRIVLTWDKQPQDLDSQMVFGCEDDMTVNYRHRTARSNVADSHELVVALDRDSATGYGPETTTVSGSGTCEAAGCCLAKFQVLKPVQTCADGKFGQNFCSEWCNKPSVWPGCGEHTLPGHDGRNTDNVDYTCSCAGCNSCVAKAFHVTAVGADACDVGTTPTQAECQDAADRAVEADGSTRTWGTMEIFAFGEMPHGCNVIPGDNRLIYNVNANGKNGMPCNGGWYCKGQTGLVCSGEAKASWATSGATVTVYKGAGRAAKYRVPLCLSDAQSQWDVFTIDTSSVNDLLEGNWGPGPYVSARQPVEQAWAVTNTQWGPFTFGNFLNGMEVQRANDPNKLQIETADFIGSQPGGQCRDVYALADFQNEKMVTCEAGEFMTSLKMSGNTYQNMHGMQQIQDVKCCKWAAVQNPAWGTCSVIDVNSTGELACPQTVAEPAGLVGFQGKWGSMPRDPNAAAPVTPKHATWNDGVYIGGEYVQIAVRTNTEMGKVGTDGTNHMAPPGFYKRTLPLTANPDNSWGIGYMGNAKGFSNDPTGELTIDYFMPGTKDESLNFGYKIAGVPTTCTNDCATKVEDTTVEGSGIASILVSGQMGDLKFNISHELGNEDTFVKTTVEFENAGAMNLDDVRFMRAVDPDNTVDHTLAKTDMTNMQNIYRLFQTDQRVLRTVAADGYAAVSSTSQANDLYFQNRGKRAMLTYFSREPSARVSMFRRNTVPYPGYPDYWLNYQTAPGNVYAEFAYDNTPARSAYETNLDGWISIAFKHDQMAPGEKKKVTFYTTMDDRPVDEQINSLAAKSYPAMLMDKIKCCGFQKTSNIEDNPTCHTGA